MSLPRGLRVIQNPPNPWASAEVEYLDAEPGAGEGAPIARLEVIEDATRQILAHNDSPDVGFRWSVNPYRGCFHGCAYCYARPSHEYLSLGAGTDFDRKIVVKPRAAELLREAFDRPRWTGELIVFSGDTDCYQPLEASYRLTRACLSVCAEYRNPCGIITKSALIERDLDVLSELSQRTSLRVTISVPFWDVEKARALEPFVPTPQRRIRTIEKLAAAGIRVSVNVAPLVPGLGDEDMPTILKAARDAGATGAGFVFLRLPGSVAPVFVERLKQALPLRAEKVLARIREARGGKLNDPRFGSRQRGEGPYALAARQLFDAETRRLGLSTSGPFVPGPSTFERPAALVAGPSVAGPARPVGSPPPAAPGSQLRLFD